MNNKKYFSAFTVIELLVVIVVIGFLAAITIVSYTGITQKANVTSLISDLNNASKLLKMDQTINGIYPAALTQVNDGKGIPSSPDTTYNYTVNNNLTPQLFCLSATKNSLTYITTESATPALGSCNNYLPVLYLDAGNSMSYSGTGNIWEDLSGNNNDVTFINGPIFSETNGGSIVFDGVNDYGSINDSVGLSFINQNYTFDYWVFFNSALNHGIIGKGQGSWEYAIYTNGSLRFSNWPLSGCCAVYNTQIMSITNNVWQHHIWSADGTMSSVYVNGLLLTTGSKLSSNLQDGPNILTIGAGGDGGGLRFLNGKIGSLKIYNRALSQQEIVQSFNSLRGRYGI